MRRAVALVVFVVYASPALAQPVDYPIIGTKLLLKQSSSGKQKLVFQSKGPSFPFPPSGGFDDPRNTGATIEIVTPGAPLGGPFVAPANVVQQPGWTLKSGGATHSYKYKRDKAHVTTTAIKGIVIKDERGITVQGEATGIPLDGARGTVGIRITIGDVRSCARFTGAAVKKDVPGAFQGKDGSSVGLADCGVAALTGQVPTCGDGDLNQSSEECEGTQCEIPGAGYFDCRPPGAANECECCTDTGLSIIPCCNPSSIVIAYPPVSKVCIPTGCTPPDSCRSGDTCQPDESCCSARDGNVCIQAYAPPFNFAMVDSVPCCPGLECRRLALPEGATCCAAGGTACTEDAECCTGHCEGGGTCEACRAGAAGCANDWECCSGSCAAGLCAACAPPGTFCTANDACCSGTCSAFQCQ